jgi:hypothetical protein
MRTSRGVILVREAPNKLVVVFCVVVEHGRLRSEARGDFELARQSAGSGPPYERADCLAAGRQGCDQPQVERALRQVRQGEVVGVQPGHELDGRSDLCSVRGCRGLEIAASGGSAPGIAHDGPLGEGADDPQVVGGEGFEGLAEPDLQAR